MKGISRIDVQVDGSVVGSCISINMVNSPVFESIIDPWVEIEGFVPATPSLNSNQQIVLEWLKKSCNDDDYTTPMMAIYKLYSSQQMAPNLVFLTKEQQFQVLAAFAQWGMKEVAD